MSGRAVTDSDLYQSLRNGEYRKLMPWIIYLIPSSLITVAFLLPLLSMVLVSVYPDFTGVAETGFTLEFYQEAFSSYYISPLIRSIWYGVATTVACLLLGYPIVYAAVKVFPEYEFHVLLLSVLPFWVMYLIRMFGWIAILQNGGFVHEMFAFLGLGIQPQLLYTSGAVVIGLVFSWYPLMVLPLYASIKGLDDDLLEAAKDLGSNSYRAFRRVTLPHTQSGIVAGSVLVFVPSFGSYVTPLLLGGPESSQMIAAIVGRQYNEAFNWPLGSALGTIMMVIVVLSLLVVQRHATIIEVRTDE